MPFIIILFRDKGLGAWLVGPLGVCLCGICDEDWKDVVCPCLSCIVFVSSRRERKLYLGLCLNYCSYPADFQLSILCRGAEEKHLLKGFTSSPQLRCLCWHQLPPSPPALNFSQYQGLFQWVGSLHQVAKVLELQLHHQSFHLPSTTLALDYLRYLLKVKLFSVWHFVTDLFHLA